MSTFRPQYAYGLACFALLASKAALAGEPPDTAAPNADMRYVAASVQRDARHSDAVLALLSLPVADRAWVQFGGGQTSQEQDANARRTTVLSAGTGYIGDQWRATLAASHRQAESSLRQTDWDGSLEWHDEQFGVGVDGHYRDARLAATVTTPTAPSGTADVSILQRTKGPGIGLHGNLRLANRFSVYAAAMRYHYRVSTQQTSAGTGAGTSLLSSVLPQTSSSLVSRDQAALSRSSKLGGSYRFEQVTLSAELLADRVLDEPGTSRTLQLKAAVELTPRWTATPTLGRTHSENFGNVTFGGLALSHAW